MKRFYNKSTVTVLAVSLSLVVFGLTQPSAVLATTTPSLGTAAPYGVLAGTFTNSNTAPQTIINGDVGYTTPPVTPPVTITGATISPKAAQAGLDQDAALAVLNDATANPCTLTTAVVDIAALAQPLTPGVYCFTGAVSQTLGTTVTLSGNGLYIFRIAGALTTGANDIIALAGGALANNVFWAPVGATTLGASNTFIGTIIDNAGITLGHFTTVQGRALAFATTITTDSNTITVPPAGSATLNVIKHVVNNNNGTSISSAWTLAVTSSNGGSGTGSAAGAESPGTAYTLQAGKAYSVVESGGPSGYTESDSADCAIANAALGTTYNCTITNDDIAPQLTVTKTVVNTGGGTKIVANFPLFIDGASVTSGVASTTTVGLHTISETSDAAYSPVIGGACASNGGITLLPGDVKTCTIVNTYIPPGTATLTVTKTVNNNHGGTKIVANFPLFIDGASVTSGVASTTSTGLHTVSETSDPGYSSTIGGNCAANGTITLLVGEVKTCTITNNDIVPQLVVTKIVVGGTKVIADFPLFIDGQSVTSGVASTTTAGLHTVAETSASNYTAVIGGNCAADGTITLLPGDLKTCTITNTFAAPAPSSGGGGGGYYISSVPPLIDVVKVPSPLALPAGPGPVTYTYTLRNIGTVPVTNITMVGDSCSPIVLVSGDTNNDGRLDVNETWVYRCTTTLSATHTNTVTATGWANGISATHIANATVVVGLPIVPPLIHVTKIPKPLALPASGGTVIYTETVTNPGTAALNNVSLTDDKCGPMKYISGDTNGDSKLDANETWVYTCLTKLTKTTTNTAIASGQANGLTATDFAIATVVVSPAIPGFPNTGLPPKDKSIPWSIVIFSGIFVTWLSLYVVWKKQNV